MLPFILSYNLFITDVTVNHCNYPVAFLITVISTENIVLSVIIVLLKCSLQMKHVYLQIVEYTTLCLYCVYVINNSNSLYWC